MVHLQQHGLNVKATDVPSVLGLKQRSGVPRRLASCHTAIVDGYVVEGHVPAADVKRMLAERPNIVGLAVPGMPPGSPGMEGPPPVAFNVYAFDDAGNIEVFSSHRP